MDPLFESRGEIDIYMDLCERIGVLFGEDGYLSVVNSELKLTDTEYELPLDQKPEVRHMFDEWAKSQGIDEGVAFFEDPDKGVHVKGPVSPNKMYGYVYDPPLRSCITQVVRRKASSMPRTK